MNSENFNRVINDTFSKINELSSTKGIEYAGKEDRLLNFKRSAKEAGTHPFKVWLIFFNKHMDAIKSYVRTRKVYSEPIEGRIDDAILYLILLKAMVREANSFTSVGEGGIGRLEAQPHPDYAFVGEDSGEVD